MEVQIPEAIRSVLIVEDEGIVAVLMEQLVRDLGVRDVYVCPDLTSALHLAATADVDLGILDLRIRGGNSLQVADALAARGIPFLFSTGSEDGEVGDRHASRPILNKPFADEDFQLIVLDTWTTSRSANKTDNQRAVG